jgi:hypothetical protein
VQELYERVALQGHFALARTARVVGRNGCGTYPGDWVVYEGRRRGQLEGYLNYEVENSRGPFKLAITLNEFVASTPRRIAGLVGYLAALADQVDEMHYAAPGRQCRGRACSRRRRICDRRRDRAYHDTGGIAGGAMMRIVDVKGALELLPLPPATPRGEIVLEVEDRCSHRTLAPIASSRATVGCASAPRAAAARRDSRSASMCWRSSMRARCRRSVPPRLACSRSRDGAAEIAESWFRARPAFFNQLNAF